MILPQDPASRYAEAVADAKTCGGGTADGVFENPVLAAAPFMVAGGVLKQRSDVNHLIILAAATKAQRRGEQLGFGDKITTIGPLAAPLEHLEVGSCWLGSACIRIKNKKTQGGPVELARRKAGERRRRSGDMNGG